ncbi:MAG TPA: hypothetical protein DEA08_12870, partial [Planctomycetes bacterium]|nr:hypothetical protein [Planctomycetota bacterium]
PRPRESLAPAPTGSVVPPRPAPKDASEAWRDAAAGAQGWPLRLARALKGEAERAALLRPFAEPSPELRRLLDLVRALPIYDPRVRRPVPFQRRLRLRYEEHQALDPGALPKESDAAVGLLLLADPSLWWQERWLLSKEGWQSVKRALVDRSLGEERAQTLLAGLCAARDGKWSEATPKLLQAFSALAEQASALAGAQQEWRQVAGAETPSAYAAALQPWTARFIGKTKGGASLLQRVKK